MPSTSPTIEVPARQALLPLGGGGWRKNIVWIALLCVAIYFVVGITEFRHWHAQCPRNVIVARVFLTASLFQLALASVFWRRQVVSHLRSFLFAPTDPINLAIFRITVFAVMFLYVDPTNLAWIGGLPPALRSIPNSLSWVSEHIPISYTSVLVAATICRASCVFAVLGLLTRTSCLIALFSGLYALVVPELFAIVHLSNHLLFFAAILACSPCGDVLSLDSLLSAHKTNRSGMRNGVGVIADTVDSVRNECAASWHYGFPIRTAWLLYGLMYFFPGFWKAWSLGSGWFTSDNLSKVISWRWLMSQPDFLPVFPIFQYPALCKVGAFSVLTFELSFLFLILFKRTRPFAVVAGLLFHTGTDLLLALPFWAMQACYPVFFDWSQILGKCKQMFSQRPWTGANAHPRRAPLQAPVSVSCKTPWPMLIVCMALLGMFILFGIQRKEEYWPFACYPTFGFLIHSQYDFLAVDAVDRDGQSIPVELDKHMNGLIPFLRYSIGCRIPYVRDEQQRKRMLAALWSTLTAKQPVLNEATTVSFYRKTVILPSATAIPISHTQPLLETSTKQLCALAAHNSNVAQ